MQLRAVEATRLDSAQETYQEGKERATEHVEQSAGRPVPSELLSAMILFFALKQIERVHSRVMAKIGKMGKTLRKDLQILEASMASPQARKEQIGETTAYWTESWRSNPGP